MNVVVFAGRYLTTLPVPDCQPAWSHGRIPACSHALVKKIGILGQCK